MVVDLDTNISKFTDKDFRKALRADPKTVMGKYFSDSGWHADDDAEYVIKTNTKNIFYVAMPKNSEIPDDLLLGSISAAGVRASSLATFISCASSINPK